MPCRDGRIVGETRMADKPTAPGTAESARRRKRPTPTIDLTATEVKSAAAQTPPPEEPPRAAEAAPPLTQQSMPPCKTINRYPNRDFTGGWPHPVLPAAQSWRYCCLRFGLRTRCPRAALIRLHCKRVSRCWKRSYATIRQQRVTKRSTISRNASARSRRRLPNCRQAIRLLPSG